MVPVYSHIYTEVSSSSHGGNMGVYIRLKASVHTLLQSNHRPLNYHACFCVCVHLRTTVKPKHILCESKTLQHCCWPTATSFTQWMNDAETWVDETGNIFLHTVFLSTPGLRAWAPRQDKRNEKTQRSAEEKLLSAQKCQRQSSYLDYRSHNPSLSLESTYSPQGLHIPGFLSGPESIYQSSFSKDPKFVQYT